jgi:hypothetical protein
VDAGIVVLAALVLFAAGVGLRRATAKSSSSRPRECARAG